MERRLTLDHFSVGVVLLKTALLAKQMGMGSGIAMTTSSRTASRPGTSVFLNPHARR